MNEDTTRLVRQARDLMAASLHQDWCPADCCDDCRKPCGCSGDLLGVVLAGLADAVEQLQAERDDEFVEKFSATHDALEQLRARVARLEAFLIDIAEDVPPDIECIIREIMVDSVPSTGQETT